jgi:YHS domain-containing protein
MASYDEDTVETDPITGEKIKHKKGELKINPETGTYYTEFLNGRNSSEK